MPGHDADRNLLFGILALQMDFIARDGLIDAMNAWLLEKGRPLGDLLVERGALDPIDRALLDPMIERHIARHGGDPQASLAGFGSTLDLATELGLSNSDPRVRDWIASLPATLAEDPFATIVVEPGAPTRLEVGRNLQGGRFRKVCQHAAGNLGVVYLAHDRELNREVALKEIKERNADQPHSQAKFLLEAEVTGGLEHPGIVPVYALGRHDDGRPYYAMRFIRGESLHDVIQRFHADDDLKSDPGRRLLALQKLLRRFIDVCNAVAYAHSRGVLHRDLKPDNVMVGKYGETLVVDWGLAKAMGRPGASLDTPDGQPAEASLQPSTADQIEATHAGSLVGTPAYMSPEQAGGRLDHLGPASDVYGLGATLYHLIAGRSPASGSRLSDVLARVQAGDFAPPRAIAPWLDPGLEAICRKAMALRPEARYESARALAEDLERWIAGEPVAAYPEPWPRKLGRWSGRHRTSLTTLASASAVAAILLGGVVLARFAQRARVDASARATLEQARGLASRAQGTGDPSDWDRAVAEARQAEARLESGGGSLALRREAADRLEAIRAEQARNRRAIEAEAKDRRIVLELGEARLRATYNFEAARYDFTEKHAAYLASFRAHGVDLGKLPIEEASGLIRSSRVADELIAALDDWAGDGPTNLPAERLSAIAKGAETDPGRAEIREAVARRDADGLRKLCRREDERRKLGPRLRSVFGALLRLDPEGSFPLLEAIRREHPSDFWLNNDLGRAYFDAKKPRVVDAVRCLSMAVALRPEGAEPHCNLGFALRDLKRLDEAEAEFRESLRIRPDQAEAHHGLGLALIGQDKNEEALPEFHQAIRIEPDHPYAHNGLGCALMDLDRLVEAEAEFRKAIRIRPDHRLAHYNLAIVLKKLGRPDEAIEEYRQNTLARPDHAEAYCQLGNMLIEHGRFREGLASLERGHELGSRQSGWDNPSERWILEARRLIELDEKLPSIRSGEVKPKDANERAELADLCYKRGCHAEAVRFAAEAMAESPSLADDLEKSLRYNTACSASLAGSGQSRDVPKPDEAARVKLRDQARGWLRANLEAWAKVLEASPDPARREEIADTLQHWKEDADLAPIRDEAALAKWPGPEREALRSLWRDVEALRKKAEGKPGR